MTDLATLAIEIRTDGSARATRDLHNVERASKQTEKAVDSLSLAVNALKRLMALGVGIQGISGFLQMADTMQSLRTQVKFVTGSLAELNKVQAELFEISQRTRSSLESTTQLYVKTSRALKDYGVSQRQVLQFTETINKAMAVGGVGAQEQASALMQLSQALGSGRLQGDEFKTIAETAPIILDVVAEYMGKSRAEVKKLASEGKITSALLFNAINSSTEKISEKFKEMPLTFGQAMQQMQNAAMKFVGDLDSAKGISSLLAQGISFLAENFTILAKAIGYATVAYVAYNAASFASNFRQASGGIGILAASFGKLTTMIRGAIVAMMANPFGAIAVAITATAFAFDAFISDVKIGASTLDATWGDAAIGVWNDFKDVVSDTANWFSEQWDKALSSASGDFDSLAGVAISAVSLIFISIKRMINSIIGLFWGGYKAVVVIWDNFPAALENLAVVAFNGLVSIAESGINALIDLLKTPIELLNTASRMFGGGNIVDTSGWTVPLDKFKLTASKQAQETGQAISEAFNQGLTFDYIGAGADGVMAYLKDAAVRGNITRKLEENTKGALPDGSNNPLTKTGTDSGKGKGKQGQDSLNEWRNYYNELERASADTWTKIALEEQRSMREMLEKAKKANVGYEEIEKAKALIAERYHKERMEIAEKYVPSLKYERELTENLKQIDQLQKGNLITAEQAGNAKLALGEKYNPLLAAQQQYINNLKEIDLLEVKGGLTKPQADIARKQQAVELKDAEWQAWLKIADRSDPFNGLKVGIKEFGDQATDVMGNVSQITGKALNGMTDALTDFVMTGKADFRGLAQSILRDITQMIIKMMIFNSLKAALGGTSFGAALGFAHGGFVGYYTGGLVGFDRGGFTGYGGKYEPAGIVHKGEYVMTKETTSRLGRGFLDQLNYGNPSGFALGGGIGVPSSGKSSINVKIINNGQPVNAKVESQETENGVELTVTLLSKMQDVANAVYSKRQAQDLRAGGVLR